MELVAFNSQRAVVPVAEMLELLLKLLDELRELLSELFALLDVVLVLERELDKLEFRLERELDEREFKLARELEELIFKLDCELDRLELETLDFELERGLDDTANELDEFKITLSELDFELTTLEERKEEREDEVEFILDEKNELLLDALIVADRETTIFLLELEAAMLDDNFASDELLEDSSTTGVPAPQAVNKKSRGIQSKALIFTLFISICPLTSGLIFNLRDYLRIFLEKQT